MNRRDKWLGFWYLVLLVWGVAAPSATVRAQDTQDVAGEWKITYVNGAVRVYTIDRHGKMEGTAGGVKVTGHAKRRNDGFTQLTFNGNDELERLGLGDDGRLSVEQWVHKADYPAKKVDQTGNGIRQKDAPLAIDGAPGVEIRDLARQWTVLYSNGTARLYTFDKDGNMRGRADDLQLSGHIDEKKDQFGRMLLTFNEEDKIERLTLRWDGRLVVEHWDPKANFPEKQPAPVGVGTPVTGKSASRVDILDALMLKCLEKIGCSGATLTVTRGKQTYYARGYGWSDAEHNVLIQPETPMSTASCDKPLTAAMIRQLAHNGKLDLNASVLKVLDIKPAGPVVDKRVWDITINHLLDHKAGWQGAPVDQAWQAANGHKYPLDAAVLVSYVAAQKLSWRPGSKAEYDSFGYNTLKRVVAKVSGRSYVDYLRHELLRPYGVKELKWVRHGAPREGEPPQLWNGLILEDPEAYRMGVSTPALCTFMNHFWIDGTPRDKGNPLWIMGGSWDNSTTEMIWRSDGINVVWSFNGRKDVDPADELWEKAINWLVENKKLPKSK